MVEAEVSMSARGPVPSTTPSELWSFLWGKRRSRRHEVALTTTLAHEGRAATCEALDLSLHGAMLRVPTSELASAPGAEADSSLGAIESLLGNGFDLGFQGGVEVYARMVRIAWRPGDDDAVYVGCEFVEPLSEATIARLGLASHHCPPEIGVSTPPAELMSYGPDPKRPLTLSVLGNADRPLFSGPLLGVEAAALATQLTDVDPTALVARLSGAAHGISVGYPGAKPWTSLAYLLAVRLLDGQTDGVEVVLSSTRAPSQALLRCMRRR
jgi:hypothetical protein